MKKLKMILFALLTTMLACGPEALAQFTTGNDTLVILAGDSLTTYYDTYTAAADTAGGTPFTQDGGRALDLGSKHLIGVNFDTTSAWTSDHFIILTADKYDASADTAGGAPYNWAVVYYDGAIFTFDPVTYDGKTTFDSYFKPVVNYSFKRYVMFKCIDASNATDTEDARRKLVPLLRTGY